MVSVVVSVIVGVVYRCYSCTEQMNGASNVSALNKVRCSITLFVLMYHVMSNVLLTVVLSG